MGPKEKEFRIGKVTDGWETEAKDATFAELTLPEFKAKIQTSLDGRKEVKRLQLLLQAAETARDVADEKNMPEVKLVVKSMAGDRNYGTNSALWQAIGMVRDDDKQTGLTRKKKTAPTT